MGCPGPVGLVTCGGPMFPMWVWALYLSRSPKGSGESKSLRYLWSGELSGFPGGGD